MKWFFLFLGGGLGSLLRVAIGGAIQTRAGSLFPWGTFCVNLVGCFSIGLIATLADERGLLPENLRVFLVAGLLGGFTTFSAFGFEAQRLFEGGAVSPALAYALASMVLGIAAAAGGVALVRTLS